MHKIAARLGAGQGGGAASPKKAKPGLEKWGTLATDITDSTLAPPSRKKNAPVRPRKKRISLVERAGMSRTQDFVTKIAEKERKNRDEDKGSPRHKKAKAGLEVLQQVTKESNDLVRKIERQKRSLEVHDTQIHETTVKLEATRKALREQLRAARGGRKASSRQEAYVVKLDALHLRLNEAITRDRTMRQEINSMRQQQMDDMMLQRDLFEERAELYRRCELVHAEAEEVRHRESAIRDNIASVKSESDAFVAACKEEWQALGIFVDAKSERERERIWNEKKEREERAEEEETKKREDAKKALLHLSPFSTAFEKGQSRRNMVAQTSKNSSNNSNRMSGVANLRELEDFSNMALAGNLTVNEENALKSSIQQSRWQIARGQVALKSLDTKANTLAEGFNMIKAKTGIETPAKMVETFLHREEEIFRLFTHVNLLSEQIEELESSVVVEREEIERYRGKEGETTSGRSILKQLDSRLSRLQAKTSVHEDVGSQASKVIDQVKTSVASMFVRIGCDTKLIENCVFHNGTGALTDPDTFNALTMSDSTYSENQGEDEETEDKPAAGNSSRSPDDAGPTPSEERRGRASSSAGPAKGGAEASATDISSSNSKIKARQAAMMEAAASAAALSPPSQAKVRFKPQLNQNETRAEREQTSSSRHLRRRLKKAAPFEDPTIDKLAEIENDLEIEMASKSLEITEKNLLQYIGVIEQRVSELLMIYNILLKQKPQDPLKEQRAVRPLPSLPSTEMDQDEWSEDDDDEDALRPLSYQELFQRVSKAEAPRM